MAIQIILRKEQLRGLAVIRDLGPERIQSIVEKLANIDHPILRPSKLRLLLEELIPDRLHEIDIIVEQLLSLYTLRRQRDIDANTLLEGLWHGIVNSTDDQWGKTEISEWKAIQPQLQQLFSLEAVWTIVKTLNLSYDYANLLQGIKILTDIRPVFDKDATEIQGSVVSYTLRISFDSRDENKSLSIALDENDVRRLLEVSKRALKKAETAKRFMNEQTGKTTFICGEED